MQASHKPKLIRHFVRADTAVRPYAEDLDRMARRWTAHPFGVGEVLCTSN